MAEDFLPLVALWVLQKLSSYLTNQVTVSFIRRLLAAYHYKSFSMCSAVLLFPKTPYFVGFGLGVKQPLI